MKFREHRGGFEESLRTLREISPTSEALAEVASEVLERPVKAEEIRTTSFGRDVRLCWWRVFLVSVKGSGALGFTDGPLENDRRASR